MSDVSKSCECLKIAAAVILPNVGGYWSSKITRANLKPWYESLKRPHWNPPNYVFAPVWISIYSSIGYASYLVYRDVTTSAIGWDGNAKTALTLYGTQLALNWAWTPLFFKYHSLKWSSIEISALAASVGACGLAFYRINSTAGWIFLPYFCWTTFAAVLNYTIYKLNSRDGNDANKKN